MNIILFLLASHQIGHLATGKVGSQLGGCIQQNQYSHIEDTDERRTGNNVNKTRN